MGKKCGFGDIVRVRQWREERGIEDRFKRAAVTVCGSTSIACDILRGGEGKGQNRKEYDVDGLKVKGRR